MKDDRFAGYLTLSVPPLDSFTYVLNSCFGLASCSVQQFRQVNDDDDDDDDDDNNNNNICKVPVFN
jgi:hypothetical protein